jgi:peptide/nickel transport system substrate-binding protein
MKKSAFLLLASGTVAAIALAGCTGATDGGSGETDTTLTIAINTPPITLDPARAAVGASLNFVVPAYASLLDRDVSGEIVASLADEWGYVGDDNTSFEISLRDGVEFADGTPITADDVVASIEYFRSQAGPGAQYFGAFTLTAVDEDTVGITSPTPNPLIPDLFTPEVLGGAIISPAGLETPEALGEATFGPGPYVLDGEQTVSGDTYVYTPNENFWDQDAIHYESITIRVIANANSAVQALQSGQIDFVQSNAEGAAAVANDANIEVVTAPSIWAGFFLLDRNGGIVPALADERVRQALNFAVDREAITQAVYGEFGTPTEQPTVSSFDGYDDSLEGTYAYDPDHAIELLDEAGFGDGLTIPANYGSFDPDTAKLVQAVQAQLAEVGVTLELKAAQNFGEWVDDLVSGQYAATVLSPGAGGAEFFAAQSQFMPGGIMNIFQAEDADLTAAYNDLLVAPVDERGAAAQEVNRIATEHALALPISAISTIVLYNSEKIDGVEFIQDAAIPTYVTLWSPR